MNNLKKTRNIALILLSLVAVAGIVVYLVLGYGTGARFDGVKRYSASITADEFDPDSLDISQIESELRGVLNADADVTLAQNLTTGSYELCISISPMSYALLTDNALELLQENYPDLGIESFTERSYSAAETAMSTAALGVVTVICWLLAFLSAAFVVGARDGLLLFALSALNSLAVFAVYVFARLDSFPLLACGMIASIILTLVVGTPWIAALDRAYRSQNKKDLAAVCAQTFSKETGFGIAAMLVIVIVAFTATALYTKMDAILPVGLVTGVALLISLASTCLALPGMWAARKAK